MSSRGDGTRGCGHEHESALPVLMAVLMAVLIAVLMAVLTAVLIAVCRSGQNARGETRPAARCAWQVDAYGSSQGSQG